MIRYKTSAPCHTYTLAKKYSSYYQVTLMLISQALSSHMQSLPAAISWSHKADNTEQLDNISAPFTLIYPHRLLDHLWGHPLNKDQRSHQHPAAYQDLNVPVLPSPSQPSATPAIRQPLVTLPICSKCTLHPFKTFCYYYNTPQPMKTDENNKQSVLTHLATTSYQHPTNTVSHSDTDTTSSFPELTPSLPMSSKAGTTRSSGNR